MQHVKTNFNYYLFKHLVESEGDLTPDGKKHGVWVRYFTTGEVATRGYYNNGKLTTMTYFDKTGRVKKTKDYSRNPRGVVV